MNLRFTEKTAKPIVVDIVLMTNLVSLSRGTAHVVASLTLQATDATLVARS